MTRPARSRPWRAEAIALAAMLVAATAGSTPLHVDAASGSDAAPGDSWASALATVTTAVARARAASMPPERVVIRVAAGTYAAADITVGFPVMLAGGYPPGGGARDPRANLTVLDALGASRVLLLEAAAGDSIVDGFTLRGSSFRALECRAPATLQNLTVSDNAGLGVLILSGWLRHSEILRNAGGIWAYSLACREPAVVSDVLVADSSGFGVQADDSGCGFGDPSSAGVVLRHVRIIRTRDPALSARGLDLSCCPSVFNVEVASTEGDGVGIHSAVWQPPPWPPPGTPLEHVTVTGSTGAAVSIGNASGLTARGSIFWANAGGDLRGVAGTIDVSSTLSESPLPGPGNISGIDPLLASAADGSTGLSQLASGQPRDSPAVNAGSRLAVQAGLEQRTTRTDGVRDAGAADLGFHRAPTEFTVARGAVPTALLPHLVGVGLPATDAGAALPPAPARLFYAVDTDEAILLRRRAGDVQILLEHQAID